MSETYVLRTKGGANVLAFDNFTRAKSERDAHAKRSGIEIQIIRQRIEEERVA